jgi:hypothetical protein
VTAAEEAMVIVAESSVDPTKVKEFTVIPAPLKEKVLLLWKLLPLTTTARLPFP